MIQKFESFMRKDITPKHPHSAEDWKDICKIKSVTNFLIHIENNPSQTICSKTTVIKLENIIPLYNHTFSFSLIFLVDKKLETQN